LDAGFKKLASDIFSFQKSRGRSVPEGTGAEAAAESMLQWLEKTDPNLRKANAKEAAAFKAGKFDDEQNIAKLKDLEKSAARDKIVLPSTMVFIINSSHEGKLKGAELEAARRFAEAQMKWREKKEAKSSSNR
jgi:hypothetical protein